MKILLSIIASFVVFSALALSATEQPLVELKDPIFDDNGPGSTTYPIEAVYQPGVFDLTAFRVWQESPQTYRFEISVRNARRPDNNILLDERNTIADVCPNDPCLQTFDLYIDTGAPKDARADWLMPGRGVALTPGEAWTRAVILTPNPELTRDRLLSMLSKGKPELTIGIPKPEEAKKKQSDYKKEAKAFMDHAVLLPRIVRRVGERFEFKVDRDWLGNDPRSCRYILLVSSSELMSSYDVVNMIFQNNPLRLLVSLPTRTGGAWEPGGDDGYPNYPGILDLLDPPAPGPNQHEILATRTLEHPAYIPFISGSGAAVVALSSALHPASGGPNVLGQTTSPAAAPGAVGESERRSAGEPEHRTLNEPFWLADVADVSGAVVSATIPPGVSVAIGLFGVALDARGNELGKVVVTELPSPTLVLCKIMNDAGAFAAKPTRIRFAVR